MQPSSIVTRHRIRIIPLLLLALILACQVVPTPPPLKSTPRPAATTASATRPAAVAPTSTPPGAPPASQPAPGDLPPFPYQPSPAFSEVKPAAWQPPLQPAAGVGLPATWEQITNPDVLAGLTSRQQDFLLRNGFVVIRSQEAQFMEVRQRVATRYGQPYFLTTDAAYYALNLSFSETLAALESQELRPRLSATNQAMLAEVMSYLPLVEGKSIAGETWQAAAYLGVAIRLFDPQASLPPEIEAAVQQQVRQIMAGGGPATSMLIPSFQDDFSAYTPTGHYTADPTLEAYYRGIAWLTRVHFDLQSAAPNLEPSRVPLILTLALRRAALADGSAAQAWSQVHETLNFLYGLSDDYGPAEYAFLMDQVYGRGATILSLNDDALWQYFLTLSQALTVPQISSPFELPTGASPDRTAWRFTGRRFKLDDYILYHLIYDRVGTPDQPRQRSNGLDLMAALGSPSAEQVLEQSDETAYAGYSEQLARMQTIVQSQREGQWLSTARNAWMYAFLPQLTPREENYPAMLRSPAWAYKGLNSSLGSWVMLKHDTRLSIPLTEPLSEGGPPTSGPPPGYVEPDPLVFYRLAYIANNLVEGLRQRGMVGSAAPDNDPAQVNLDQLLVWMQDLGDRLQRLGDIAAKELAGQPLDESERFLIQAPLGSFEERTLRGRQAGLPASEAAPEMPRLPVITTLDGDGEKVLQIGIGGVDRIFILAPEGEKLAVAQGGVFSYFELPLLRSESLDDQEWQRILRYLPPEPPLWSENFVLPGGAPVDVLAFRAGDVYRITSAAADLNVREAPARGSKVIHQLQPGDYVMIVDGPVQADDFTWWKFSLEFVTGEGLQGWAVQESNWYERAWGQ